MSDEMVDIEDVFDCNPRSSLELRTEQSDPQWTYSVPKALFDRYLEAQQAEDDALTAIRQFVDGH